MLVISSQWAIACNGGPLGIDHRLSFDESGIWNRNIQQGLLWTMVGGEIVGGVWEGGDTRLGKTFWQSIDSSALGAVSSTALKYIFGRPRPSQINDPCLWFKGSNFQSFPSGEVTAVTAIVTPFIFEYRHDYPAVYALELLPLYDAIARMKSQAHWQTDVLAAFGLGTFTGYLSTLPDNPVILGVLPHGFTIGLKKSF
jgi:membrane-associated phospholipid phosphatase